MTKYTPKTEKRHSDETKAKIRAKLRKLNEDPEYRAMQAEARAKNAEKIRQSSEAYNARVAKALALLEAQEREANNA